MISLPTPSPTSSCEVVTLVKYDKTVNLVFLSVSLVVSVCAFLSHVPLQLVEVWKTGCINCNNVLISGILGAFVFSSVAALCFNFVPEILHKDQGKSKSISDLTVLLWGGAIIESRLWMLALFIHSRWVLKLPELEGDMLENISKAKAHLTFMTKILVGKGIITFVLFIGLGILNTTQDFHAAPFFALMPFFFIGLTFALVAILGATVYENRGRSLGEPGIRLRWCLLSELTTFFLVTTAVVYFTSTNAEILYRFFIPSEDQEFYSRCIHEFADNYMILLLCFTTVTDIISLFPFSGKRFCGNIGTMCRYCADCHDEIGSSLDSMFCPAKQAITDTDLRGGVGIEAWAAKSASLFDFSLTFGMAEAQILVPDGHLEETGEQTIMRNVGTALSQPDTFNLVIPPEFISISAKPIAAGGFGQVHTGVFAGKRVAVKKVFTQLSEGDMSEFTHEVRMLSNLRGVPHVMLLHGVSVQIEQGEQVFIMVLEWCPLSLSDLVRGEESSTRQFRSDSAVSTASNAEPTTERALSQSLLERKIMEDYGTVEDSAPRRINPRLFYAILRQLTNALHMLHHKGYVHRDLKPQVKH